MTSLDGPQFFHGTRAPLDVGDTLLPHNQLPGGEANYGNFQGHSKNRVFMADDENRAWQWSRGGENHAGERRSVLKVTPGNSLVTGPSENHAETAKVTERIDVQPGRQGTLPVNWNQFSSSASRGNADRFNHPTNLDIEMGHDKGAKVARMTRKSYDAKTALHGQEVANDVKADLSRGQGRLF